MNTLTKTLLISTLCLIVLSCETEPTNNNSNSATDNTSIPDNSGSAATDPAQVDGASTQDSVNPQDCTIAEKHFDQNIFFATDEAQLISIVANESTKDPDLGDSHRVLKVLNAKDCNVLLEKTLPINRSADFPYYLAPNTYEFDNQIVGIQGFSSLHYYDVKAQQLIGPIIPQYQEEKEAVDAQSGMVKGLTVWKNYLLGHALDFGNFAYDISDVSNPKPVFSAAEHQIKNTSQSNTLFILETEEGVYQAIIPVQDLDAGGNTFDLYRLFKTPLPINPKIASNVKNNRFIVFNQNGNDAKVAVDMFSKKQVDLPDDIAKQNTGAILEWLKANS